MLKKYIYLAIVALALTGCQSRPPVMKSIGYGAATHPRGVIACVNPLAARAAIEAYEKGGNAVDAAVAAAVTLGVVDGQNSGIGGGCFILIHKRDGTILAIDGREMAPAAATAAMYLRNGKADTDLSQTGALAIGVPGSVAAYDLALKEAGKRTLRDALLPAADLAERGFIIDNSFASRLRGAASDLAKFESSRAILLDASGKPLPKGHTLKQPDLAKTYRAIADEGIGYFYGGPFARAVETWMKQHGGVVTAKDFADYQVKRREPIVTTYRGYTVIGFPPPSSGGVHVAQMLNILERADIGKLDAAARSHLSAEAMKLAFADRAHWLGDPDFVKVPRGLIDKAYAKSLFDRIDPAKASEVIGHGVPRVGWAPPTIGALAARQVDVVGSAHPKTELVGGAHPTKHTTHIAAADVEGNWVAITATVNTTFGSKVIIPGTGVVMNNQMDDFSIQPGVPNAFRLVGGDANAVAPGKRPLSSMTPTIVLKDGKPVLTLGAAGGPTIITAVLCTLVNKLDQGMSVADAVAAPRVHHQWKPDELRVEKGLDPAVIARLRAMGHTVREVNSLAVLQAIGVEENGEWTAVTDPRVAGE